MSAIKSRNHLLLVQSSNYKAYTTEFDQVRTATDILNEQLEKYPWTPITDKYYYKNRPSEETISNARLFAENYRNRMLEKYWYIPAITFLVDNSWSLGWESASFLKTMLIETTWILEEFKIPFEVLGYTTARWNWWQSKEKWIKDWRPGNPWRLNDLLHIVYKSFDESISDVEEWFFILCSEVLRENIDWEALMWADSRKPEKSWVRHIVHLSDWAPVDDSTLSVNPGDFLQRNLVDTLTALKKDENTLVHSVSIDWKVNEEVKALYDTNSSVKINNNPVDEFFNNFFSKLTEDSLDEIKDRKRSEVLEILGLEDWTIWNDDILKICWMIDLWVLRLLKEFWLSWIDIILNINTPLKDVNQSLFRINLSIVKNSWRVFWQELSKLIPFLINFEHHELLQNILNENLNIDQIISILKNFSKYIEISSWKPWQKAFLAKYAKIFINNLFNFRIFSFLVQWDYIEESDIDNLWYVLINWNFQTVKILLESWVKLGEIITSWDVISYHNVDKLFKNLDLLKEWIKNIKSNLEKIRFCISVDTEMLELAISFWVTDFNDLKLLQESLSEEYSEKSIENFFRAFFTIKERKKYFWSLIFKLPIATIFWTIYYNSIDDLWIVWVWSFVLAAWFIESVIKWVKNINKNIERNTKTATFLFVAHRNFMNIIDSENFTKENSKKLEEYFDDIMNEKDEEIFKILWIDKNKIKVLYFIFRLKVILENIPDLSYLTDKTIAEETLWYIKELIQFWPIFITDLWYNFKKLLELKSIIESKFWYEQTDLSWKIVDKKDYKDACKVLWVSENASLEEINARFKELAKIHHSDIWWEHDKMAEINNARDTIYTFRWWN